MKRILTILTVMLTAFFSTAFADNEADALIVTQKNGTQTVFAFEKKPVISFLSETMTITAIGSTSFSLPLADVKNYTFGNMATGIDNVAGDNVQAIIQNGVVKFQKLSAGQSVNVFSIDGKMVRSVKVDSNGSADLDLSTLPKGILVVKSPTTQIKFNNK